MGDESARVRIEGKAARGEREPGAEIRPESGLGVAAVKAQAEHERRGQRERVRPFAEPLGALAINTGANLPQVGVRRHEASGGAFNSVFIRPPSDIGNVAVAVALSRAVAGASDGARPDCGRHHGAPSRPTRASALPAPRFAGPSRRSPPDIRRCTSRLARSSCRNVGHSLRIRCRLRSRSLQRRRGWPPRPCSRPWLMLAT